jgi:hypothetical protein
MSVDFACRRMLGSQLWVWFWFGNHFASLFLFWGPWQKFCNRKCPFLDPPPPIVVRLSFRPENWALPKLSNLHHLQTLHALVITDIPISCHLLIQHTHLQAQK